MGTPNHWTIALVLRQLGSIVQAGHADFYRVYFKLVLVDTFTLL